MAIVHMSEADVVRDIAAVLAQVRQGVEVVVEQDHHAVAVIKPSQPAGRMVSEVIAHLEARGSDAVVDEEFARDVEEGIKAQRQPWSPPSWD
jgi:antitoxin (DNA-binding transcriptional repressor) of toxin-antitoxin stability system